MPLLEQICYLPSNVVISFDQLYFLAFWFHPNLLHHDLLRPELTASTSCAVAPSLQDAGVLQMGEESVDNITSLW